MLMGVALRKEVKILFVYISKAQRKILKADTFIPPLQGAQRRSHAFLNYDVTPSEGT
jgi:hypothetical protein